MLVVKVEVWPGGDGRRAQEISRLGISNVSGLRDISDYELTAIMGQGADEYLTRHEINKHDRAIGWVPLLRRALTEIYLTEPGDKRIPYDDPTVEHLRKDGYVHVE